LLLCAYLPKLIEEVVFSEFWLTFKETDVAGYLPVLGVAASLPAYPSRLHRDEPQGDVGGLHRLPDHARQVVAQGVQIGLVAQRGREGFQGLPRVVLPTVEATVYEGLDVVSQGVEQSGYHEGGSNDSEGGLLAGENDEDSLQQDDAPEVHNG
jgi:hypothetical protein